VPYDQTKSLYERTDVSGYNYIMLDGDENIAMFTSVLSFPPKKQEHVRIGNPDLE